MLKVPNIKISNIKLPEQKKIDPFWGGLKELIGRVMFYAGIINFFLIIITAYHTSIKDISPIPFWVFLAILLIGLFVAMIFEYIFMLPSSIAFSNRQSYKHDNPIKVDMDRLLHKLDNVNQKLQLLENDIKIIKEGNYMPNKQSTNNMSTWKQPTLIKNGETCELQITEKIGNGTVTRKVIIKNGQVVEKPADVNILGDETPDGFIIRGLQIIKKRD